MMSTTSEQHQQLQSFLQKIQLNHFYVKIVDILHITRVEHFEHVIDSDLKSIGMSMPEIRRLFDNLKKSKKRFFISRLKGRVSVSLFKIKVSLEKVSHPLFISFHNENNKRTKERADKSFKISNINNDQESTLYSDKEPNIRKSISTRLKSPKHEAKCLIQENDIKFIQVIGRGAFGSVRSAEWTTQDNEKILVAVKCIRQTTNNGVEDVQNEIVKEASAMSCLNHPNLIQLFGVLITSPMMLVTELAPLGTLLKRLRQENEKFQISRLSSFLVQIAAGMKYLEQNKIVHRDLAARNILLTSYEKVKIGDFGLARLLEHSEHYVMHPDGLMPFAWCAPECLKYKRFSHSSDVWAFGITAYELFTYGAEPWAGLNGGQILEKIEEPNSERPSCPEFCPREIYTILYSCCWNYQETERASFQSIEKKLLEELPTDVKVINWSHQNNVDDTDSLNFISGDTITIFNTNSYDGIWKGQNRRTGEVGYVSSDYVNINAYTISDQVPLNHSTDGDALDSTSNRLSVPQEGFVNKLWTTTWEGLPDSLGNKGDISSKGLATKLSPSFKDGFEYSFGAGCRQASLEADCEDCLSQSSIDSGCLCRCSTYSSDSSQRYSSEFTSTPLSKPISIPGQNTRARGTSYNANSMPERQRCSSCCSSNRHSVFSDTLDRDSSMSNSPNIVSPNFEGIEKVQRSMSNLTVDNTRTKDRSRQLSVHVESKDAKTLIERRRSLPDLANPRKKSLLQRSFRLRKRKENLKNTKEVVVSSPISSGSSSQFYIRGQEALISHSPVPPTICSSSLELKPQCNLYDLVPIRHKNMKNVILNNEATPFDPRSTFDAEDSTPDSILDRYDTPPARSSTTKISESNKDHPVENQIEKEKIYENMKDFISTSPVAPPRRKKRQSSAAKRYSMFELGTNDDMQYGSPTARQCIILDANK